MSEIDELDRMMQEIEGLDGAGGAPPPVRGHPPPLRPRRSIDHSDDAGGGYETPRNITNSSSSGGAAPKGSGTYLSPTQLGAKSAPPAAGASAAPARASGGYAEPRYTGKPGDGYSLPLARPDAGGTDDENPYETVREPAGSSSAPRNDDSTNRAALPSGHCALCRQKINGKIVHALGLAFHDNHFQCIKCEQSLADVKFFAHAGMPYCGDCFNEMHSPTCAGCKKPVVQSCLQAMGKTWHADCFRCQKCSGQFGSDGFVVLDDQAVCIPCYQTPCKRCGKPVDGTVLKALDGSWHEDCFVCAECQKPFPNGEFFDVGGQPYCATHYHAMQGMLCAGCMAPIVGKYLNALGQKWHPEHFSCALCMKSMANIKYRERKGQAYCDPCYVKMFG